MNYNLNKKIEVPVFRKIPSSTKDEYVSYRITHALTGETLYVGRLFYPVKSDYAILYLNDIISSLKSNLSGLKWLTYDWLDPDMINQPQGADIRYEVMFGIRNISGGNDIIEQEITVDMYHPQRNLSDSEEYEEAISHNELYVTPLISGIKTYLDEDLNIPGGKCKLLPTIPDNYVGGWAFSLSSRADTISEGISIGKIKDGEWITLDTIFAYAVSKVENYGIEHTINIDDFENEPGDIIYAGNKNTFCEMLKIDCGYSKYYLKWFDRCWGIQMQPFRCNDKYKTDYSYIYKTNKYNEEEMISVSSTDTITLNTGWLNEDVLPYYESMFVSPYLCLYNNERKKHYKVTMVDKSFEYKTFKNQGNKMFNLQITLKLSQNENIIY